MTREPEPSAIIIFDGVCNFCNGSVNFILKRDVHKYFYFAPKQSPVGQRLLRQHYPHPERLESLVVLEAGQLYIKSAAVLKIARHLGGLWSLLYVFVVVPAPLRDWLYGLVAKYRYKIAGERSDCLVPTADVRARFLLEETV